MNNILKDEILSLTKAVRVIQKQYFKSRDKDILNKSKAMEKELDAKIAQADAEEAGNASLSEFNVNIKITFDAAGEMIMRPEFPGQLIAANAISALLSTASNLQRLINMKAGDDVLRKSTIKVAELFS